MIANSCIKIETNKFPVLEGEKEEIFNDNMYGKALCQYLKEKLPEVGVTVPFFCSEDWGWWLEVEYNNFSMGLCIYSEPGVEEDPKSYAIMPSIHSGKKWSWLKLRRIDVSKDVLGVIDKVIDILEGDNEIINISRSNDFPY